MTINSVGGDRTHNLSIKKLTLYYWAFMGNTVAMRSS